jgi:serine/threonine-protein kinase RsbW
MKISETIPSRLELVPEFISSLVERLYHLPLDEYLVFKIKLAIQEAVINAVEHGNKMQSDLSVQVDIVADPQRLTIEVTDQGSGFDYTVIPNPTEPENIEKLRGRGIFLIRHAMNKIEFTNKGRTIRMIKYLEKERRAKMQAQVEKVNDVAVLALEGEINVTNSMKLRETFIKTVNEGMNKFLADFEKVTFIDSSGLAVLIEMVKRLKENNGRLILCNVNVKIKGLFEITKVHKLIDIYENRETALAAF